MRLGMHPDFDKEVQRPFDVHENCYDCAEFYDGCKAWPQSKEFNCADFHRLPDVMPGTCGQVFPPSRMRSRREPRERKSSTVPTGDGAPVTADGNRYCECGASLLRGKRLCDRCRIQNRRKTMREHMRHKRASVAVDIDSGWPFSAAATHATRPGGEENTQGGTPGRSSPLGGNFCITKPPLRAIRQMARNGRSIHE